MVIKVLDKATMGEDTPFDKLFSLADMIFYDTTASDEVKWRISDADAVILNKVRLGKRELEGNERLRLICTFATGYDNIDTEYCKRAGIAVCNVPGYSTESVTLMTVATVLALQTKLFEYSSYVSSGKYSESGVANRIVPVYHELAGKKWGIVGYGNIGRSVAAVAKSFGASVLYYKRTPDGSPEYRDIDTICSECDVITLHCPLNAESFHLIDKRRLSMMKPSAILVNESRGAVVNESDVAEAIKSGTIAAFGCDVYSSEPFGGEHPYNELLGLKNVILTPHSAWASYEARERCVTVICENIKSFNRGETLNRVDK